jgi:hypothetical protein
VDGKLLAFVGVLLVVLAGVVGALVTGVGPLPSGEAQAGADGDADAESFPTATPAAGSTGDGGGGDGTTATVTPEPPFALTIDAIEECGQTCRDVTSSLINQQDTTARNVTVYTRIFVGNGTGGDVAWQGRERVGTLEAGGTATATRRVDLSYSEALAIQRNGGWITVQTTVETADRTVTFSDRRQVA